MTDGTIVAENVSRTFRVYPQRNVTLKEAIVRRRTLRPVEVRAVQDVSFEIEPGASIGFMGRNGSGKTTLLRMIAGVFRPSSGRLTVKGRVGSLLELGAGFHPDFIDLPVRTYSSGMHMRLGFSVATNVEADILLLDEVFAVGDEAFQRKCVDRVLEFREQGKTIAFVSHSGAAVERMCDRAILLRQGAVEYDGETSEAIRRYQQLLAGEEDPAERAAGLREWGTGQARVSDARLEGELFRAGDRFALRLRVEAAESIEPPQLLIELRDLSGALLGRAERGLGELGWDGRGAAEVRFEVEHLPLAEGQFQVNLALTDAAHSTRYHSVEKAVEFTVLPEGEPRGFFLFEGEWALNREAGVMEPETA
jgi:ABC-type polysaccharide/polyol phosphate transport system ATPase subunit